MGNQVRTKQDEIEGRYADFLAEQAPAEAEAADAVEVVSPDETEFDVRLREKREARAVELRAALDDVKSRRPTYRDLMRSWPGLAPGEYRVLDYHLSKANNDLDSSFTGRRTGAAALNMRQANYDSYMQRLRNKGVIVPVEFRREDGTQASSGLRFCIPAGVLGPGDPGWTHDPKFRRRKNVVRRQTRRKKEAQ
ncbi:MAG: hypothetical protein ACYSVY_01055 [Planctomycetota bacterium]|jgi:hypothetical protein